MSFQYLPEDQRARYRRFLTDPSPEDLERFFYLDAVALAEVAKKRGPHNRLGWAVQWGTVRMLLPGITTLAPLVTSVRAEQLAAINDHLVEQTPLEMRRELLGTLVVPEGKEGVAAGVDADRRGEGVGDGHEGGAIKP